MDDWSNEHIQQTARAVQLLHPCRRGLRGAITRFLSRQHIRGPQSSQRQTVRPPFALTFGVPLKRHCA